MEVKITIESKGKHPVVHTYKGYHNITAMVIAAAQGVMTTIKHMFSGETYPTQKTPA